MLRESRALRLAAVCAALAWSLVFVHIETTDRSMIRAILLQRGAEGWAVGFLYQSPEPSADASEAAAEVAFAASAGETLEKAVLAAERALQQSADYRLCDHVLLFGGDNGALDEYKSLLLKRQCGRLAARVEQCAFTFEELSEASEETPGAPRALLQCAKLSASTAPRLFERKEGLVLPVLELTDNGAARRSEGVFLLDGQQRTLTANETQAALLLRGEGENYSFDLDGQSAEFAWAICSLTVDGDSVSLRVDCLPSRESSVTREQAEELEELLSENVERFWRDGADILSLRAAFGLKYGEAKAPTPGESACPKVSVEVRVWG